MLTRRTIAAALAALATVGGCLQTVQAQSYPSRVIKLILHDNPDGKYLIKWHLLTRH